MSEKKKNISFYIIYYSLYSVLKVIAFFPFFFLYLFADFLYYVVYHVVRYRRQIVRDNLSGSFPDKSHAEIKTIEKKFYRHYCNCLMEAIKLFNISDKEMSKRMVFKNVDVLNDILNDSQSAILCIGHYGNWEWVTSLNLLFDPAHVKLSQVYKKISNKAVDDIFLKLRSRFESDGIDKNIIYREIIRRRRDNQNLLIGFIADQSPSVGNIHHWIDFLNRNTPVFIGIEKIAKQTDFAVAYLDIECVKRGYYVCDIKLITKAPKEEPDYFITKRYFELLEDNIKRAPAYWLWSHKRWKYTNQGEVDKILKRKNA